MGTPTAPPSPHEVSNLTERESLVRLREIHLARPPRAARRRRGPPRRTFARTLVKNLLRACVSTVCYQRALFPPDCFPQKKLSGIAVQHLQCKTKNKLTNKVIVHNEEGALLTSWLEEGVFDALQKRYLKTLQFAVTNGDDAGDNVLESYHFEFKYPSSETFQVNDDAIDAGKLKAQAQKLMRNLTELSNTLDDLPDARAITMALRYYDDVTPPDYEPAFFVGVQADDCEQHAATSMTAVVFLGLMLAVLLRFLNRRPRLRDKPQLTQEDARLQAFLTSPSVAARSRADRLFFYGLELRADVDERLPQERRRTVFG